MSDDYKNQIPPDNYDYGNEEVRDYSGGTSNYRNDNYSSPYDTTQVTFHSSEFTAQTASSDDSWLKSRWRPLVAWQYIFVCFFDFVIGPVLTMIFFYNTDGSYVQWMPLTIQGGGLYHLAMGAVLGITSWSRGQEKLKRIER